MPQISISSDIVGKGSITIDGVDIAEVVSGLDISIRVGQVTRITITCVGDLVLQADAQIQAVFQSFEQIVEAEKERPQP
jgi:hypothetical protein